MTAVYGDLRAFFSMGGPVLVVIALVALVMWTLLFERYSYFRFGVVAERESLLRFWTDRRTGKPFQVRAFRSALVSSFRERAMVNLGFIRALIAACPLLGILGTVTGMIEVFEVLSIVGTGNAREIASGVSRATIPTMAGLVVALSGYYFRAQLGIRAERHVHAFAETLSLREED